MSEVKKALPVLFSNARAGARERTSLFLHVETYEKFKEICASYNTTTTEAINALLADVVADYEHILAGTEYSVTAKPDTKKKKS